MMERKRYLVTGGTGFLGSALVRRLVELGHKVRVLDNEFRSSAESLQDVAGDCEFIKGDVRRSEDVLAAARGVDSVCHLACINGTELFYSKPELVLEVAVKGMVHVLDACARHDIGELVLASSSEVYQTPPSVPTDEDVPLSIPNPRNPRYSYAAGKLISEIMALNYGRTRLQRVVVFRPHNVYGPAMGWEHVVPQFSLRMREIRASAAAPAPFQIQGTGRETRAFIHIEDFTDGLLRVIERGEHMGIYHIGTTEEVTIEHLALSVASCLGKKVEIVPGSAAAGGTPRRCPDITRLGRLGFQPKIRLQDGLPDVVHWYDENAHRRPSREPAGQRT